jgi:hypothetical protein
LLGHALLGLAHGKVVHLDADFAGQLQLDFFQDQPLQHLARQHVCGRQGSALLGHLLLRYALPGPAPRCW